jgi:hypothetical protein
MQNEMDDLSKYRQKNLNYLGLLKRGSEGNKSQALQRRGMRVLSRFRMVTRSVHGKNST